jgi:Thiamine pyrophosphate enzyme, central domain
VAGKGVWYPLVSAALIALAEALEAPVCHTWEGHGAMPTVHPLSLGPYHVMESHPAVLTELGAADLILGVGVRVRTEPFLALQGDYGDRLLILDAADADLGVRPGDRIGPVAGRVATRIRRGRAPVAVGPDRQGQPAPRRSARSRAGSRSSWCAMPAHAHGTSGGQSRRSSID